MDIHGGITMSNMDKNQLEKTLAEMTEWETNTYLRAEEEAAEYFSRLVEEDMQQRAKENK